MWHKRFALAVVLMTLTGCANAETAISGSGKKITDKRSLSGDFQKISINVPASVVVEIGKNPAS